MFAMLSIY